MECRTRLGLAIFLFGLLLVSVLVLIRQVIPPVHVLPPQMIHKTKYYIIINSLPKQNKQMLVEMLFKNKKLKKKENDINVCTHKKKNVRGILFGY